MSHPPALTPLASTLGTIARQYGLEAKLLEYRLRHRWRDVAGDQIATHTRPDTVRFRKLYLIAESSVWLQQLMFLKPALIARINAAAGSEIISDIVLRVGEMGGEAPQADHSKATSENTTGVEREPTAELLAESVEYAQPVTDPDLRAHLATVMARALTHPAKKAP